MFEGEIGQSLIRVSPFLVLLLVIFIRVRQGRIAAVDIGIAKPNSWASTSAWLLGFLGFALLVEFLLWQAEILELGGFKHQGLSAAIRIIGMVLLAPVAEELLFRGIFLNLLEKWIGKFTVAAAIQAAIFVALHNFTYTGSVASNIGVAQSFVDAMLFAYARRHTGSILTPVIMHASGNFIAVLEMMA